MIYLTNIRLINWHLFSDVTLSLNDHSKINLIAGNNSAGKSTLNDALYYVLSGGDKDNFNVASSGQGDRAKNSDRSLYTYIRGKTQSDFLRKKDTDVISYIALEFFNELSRERFILCAYLESRKGEGEKDVTSKFFAINGGSVTNDSIFYKENKTLKEFNDIKSEYGYGSAFEEEKKDTRYERKRFVSEKLHFSNASERYYSILKKALSFNRIENINDFFKIYLLDDSKISDELKRIEEKFKTYDELNQRAQRIESQVDSLKLIVDCYNKYLEEKNDFETNLYFENKLSFAGFLDEIDKLSSKLDSLKNEISRLNRDKNELDTDVKNAREELYKITSTEDYTSYNALNSEIKNIKNKLNDITNDLKEFNSKYDDAISLFKEKKYSFEFIKDLKERTVEELDTHFEKLRVKINNEKDELTNNKIKEQSNLFTLKNRYSETLNELKSYEANKFSLPKFINDLFDELSIKFKGKDFSLLVQNIHEVENNKFHQYMPLIEALLSNYKYDLFCEKEIYKGVLEVYKTYINRKDYIPLHIVRKELVKDENRFKGEENSLINALSIENNFIYNYVYQKLNGYIITNFDIKNLPIDNKKYINFNGDVFYNGNVYKNLALSNNSVNKPYLDMDRIKKYIEHLKYKLERLENEQNESSLLISSINKDIENLDSIDIIYLKNNTYIFDRFNNLSNSLKEKNKELTKLKEENLMIVDIDNIIKSIEEKIKNYEDKIKENDQLILNKLISQHDLENKIINLNSLKEETEVKIREFESGPLFKNNLEIPTKTKIEEKKKINQFNISMYTKEIQKLMINYAKKFNSDFECSIEGYDRYYEEYNTLKNNALVKAKDELSRNKEDAHQMFKDDFVGKVSRDINEAKTLIKRLNKRLSKDKCIFGKEKYQIKYNLTKDNEFNKFGDLVYKEEVLDKFATFDTEKEELLNELFNLIFSSSKNNDSTVLNKFSNYKNYLDFDIEITDIEKNTKSLMSDSLKERSGGETQTPFYIILGASFDSIEGDENKGSGVYNERASIVLFDEAFNNMDKSRCEPLMEFFKELDVEVFMIMHSDRVNSVFNEVDTCIGISRIGDKCSAYIMSKEEVNDAE